MHRAARIENRYHDFRERRARRRGHRATIVPYTGYGSTAWVRVLGRVLLTAPSKSQRTEDQSVRGWRSFTSVPSAHAEVTVDIAGTRTTVIADRGGVIDTTVQATLTAGWQTISLSTHGGRTVEAPIFIVSDDSTVGMVSDIDDTVMVTALPRPFLAAWNTFVLDEHARTPTPGMAVLYERLRHANPDSPMVYLSTGAWNVAPTLTRFLSRNLYPAGALLLTDWGPTHDRWFRSGSEHKRTNLLRLVDDFPSMKWLLVGDDGQHDEQLYGELVESHPDNVVAVLIRQLSIGEAVLAGGRAKAEAHSSSPVPWLYAPDGAGLSEQLDALGLLSQEQQVIQPEVPPE